MQRELTGSWAEEPEGHAPSAPRSAGPAQSRCGLRAERAEHWERAAWGDPAAAWLARRLRSPSPRPSGRAARAAPGRWRCTFRSVRRAAGLERRRVVGGGSRPRPRAQPLAWERWGGGHREAGYARPPSPLCCRSCSGVPAGGSRGGGVAIRPSRPARGPCTPREPELGGPDGGS